MGRTPELVLATDLDGTLLGGDERQRRRLYQELDRRGQDIVLIFVTGRDLAFVTGLSRLPGFPTPDFVICDVGTTIVRGHDHAPVPEVEDWVDRRWERADELVRELLADEPGLELQPVIGGRRVSYFYDPALLRPGAITRIQDAGFGVIASAGRFLDVLPRGVAKGPSLRRLVDVVSLPHDAVLVAGDTLNDLSLFGVGFRGVVVGNAEPALVDAVSGLRGVHHSRQPGCAGITDAIGHFGYLATSVASLI